MRRSWLLSGLSLALLLAGPAVAEQEKESKAAKRVAKNMQKLKSYRVAATIRGGMAQGADHRITQARVSVTYVADVVGGVMKVDSPQKAFRKRMGGEGDGAIQEGGKWKAILGTAEGRQMARLFRLPEHHLATVAKYSKLGRWLPPEAAAPAAPVVTFGEPDEADAGAEPAEGADESAEDEAEPAEDEAEPAGDEAEPAGDEAEPAGDEAEPAEEAEDAAKPVEPEPAPVDDLKKTRTRKGKRSTSKSRAGDGPLSHRMIIECPTSEAVEHFTIIVNSGCLGGGWGVSETLSRADRKNTKMVYELRFDAENEYLEELKVTTLCASRGEKPVAPEDMFSSAPHIAFTAVYTFSDREEVERFPVPTDAGKMLK